MNIDRYWTQVEDANQYYHIYRSKHWHPAWIHSTPLSAKGKTLPTLNHSPVTQQPEISCQSYCCALVSEENRGGELSASLGFLAYGDRVQPWITLHGIQKSFLCSLEGKAVHLPASSISWRAKENLLLFKVSKSSIRKLFHVMCGHCMSFPISKVTVSNFELWIIVHNVMEKQFSTWYQTRLKRECPHLLQCIRDNTLNSNNQVLGIFPLLCFQTKKRFLCAKKEWL